MKHFFPDDKDNPERPMLLVAGVFKELEAKIVRWNILDTSKRIDGRDLKTVRPIVSEAGILPRARARAKAAGQADGGEASESGGGELTIGPPAEGPVASYTRSSSTTRSSASSTAFSA